MGESVAVAKEADAKKSSSPTRSSNSVHRVQNDHEMQLGSLGGVIGNIRSNGGKPSVESIATQLSSMHSTQRAPMLLALQQTHGNQYVQRVVSGIQAKLVVGQPGDIYEQEADRVADAVMRMPEPQVEEGEEELLHAKSMDDVTPEVTHDLESQINTLRGGGKSLSEYERGFFEPRFGVNFGQVRVHTGTQAAESAQVLNARAYTLGQDVVFGAGQYAPVTGEGQKLMAHELTHVVQQNSDNIQRKFTVGQPGYKYEQEAESMAKQVVSVTTSGSQLPVQRTGLYGEELQKRFQLESDSLIMPRTTREPSTRRYTHIANFASDQIVQRNFWSSLRRGGGMYFGMDRDDAGAPFARRLMEWRIIGFGRDFVVSDDLNWTPFMIGRPEIQRAMTTKFESLALRFAAAGPDSGEFEDSITGVRLDELESMRLTLHGCHRIDISGEYEVIEDGTDTIVRLSHITFVWVDEADLHPGIETDLDSGELVDDSEFTGAGWDYDIRISFGMPRTSTWRVSGGTATHERGWPPITGAPAAGFRG